MKRDHFYQDLRSVIAMRDSLCLAYQISNHVARQSRLMVMRDKQSAAAVLLPQALHIGNSIDRLIESAMLLSAGILMRPMWERIGTACYFIKNESAVNDWRKDWKRKNPPQFQILLDSIEGELGDFKNSEGKKFMHSIVHGNWSAMWFSISANGKDTGVSSGPNINSPDVADSIAMTTAVGLHALSCSMYRLFPLHLTDLDDIDIWQKSRTSLYQCGDDVLRRYEE